MTPFMTDEKIEIEATDRYGGRYPDPATICPGQCEGMGFYPQPRDDENATEFERREWEKQHRDRGPHDCDGFHFIPCEECNGTGKKGYGY